MGGVTVSSETHPLGTNLLKRKVYVAARNGKAATIIEALEQSNTCGIVQEILNHHTEESGQNTTPLIIAARNGHEHVVSVLLRLGANVEQTGTVVIYEETIKAVTALWCASAVGHLGIVKLLIEHGANVNSKTPPNSTVVRAACFDGHLNVVKFLVEHDADIDALSYKQNSCLSLAANKGHCSLVEYLIQRGVDVNQKISCGWTALHACAENNQVNVIDLLLKYGAKITKNDNNMTPLMISSLKGMSDTVEYFVEKTDCSRNDKIDALELLATTFAVMINPDLDKAYYYLRKAMEERYMNKTNTVIKRAQSPVPAYNNWIECRNLCELEAIKTNSEALQMECLAIRERLLGPGHQDVADAIADVGASFVNEHEYAKGLKLWHYALKQDREIQTVCALRFPGILAIMMERNMEPERTIVLEIFQILSARLRQIMLQINEENGDKDSLQKSCEETTIACVYLIGILLNMSKNEDDQHELYQVVYKFIRQKPYLRNGFTPLHMCCSIATYTGYESLLTIVPFPNASLCKAFINCGSNVNDIDNGKNTPLHTVVSCFKDYITDIDTFHEILTCLIESGAHLDIRNKENKTAADIVNIAFVEDIIVANREFSLKCLAATAIRKTDVQYKGIVPRDLQEFVELH